MNDSVYTAVCELIVLIDRVQHDFYIQDYYNGMKIHRQILSVLTDFIENKKLCLDFESELMQKLTLLLDYQQAEDYIGMADFYNMQLKPLCQAYRDSLRADGIWQEVSDRYCENYKVAGKDNCRVLDSINAENEDIPEGYELIETAAGDFTLQVNINTENGKKRKLLLASTDNPMSEACQLVEAYCNTAVIEVNLLGLAMGHLVKALVERDDIININVYETDKYVIKAAFHYADMTDVLDSGKFNLIYDPQLLEFSRRLSQDIADSSLIIHRPSMMKLENKLIRDKLNDFFLHDISVKSQWKKLYGNFYMNTSESSMCNIEALDTLENVFAGRQMLFIAGGPSLENDIPLLSDCSQEYTVTTYSDGVESQLLTDYMRKAGIVTDSDEYIVVCAGTVLSALVSNGIIPDYVVMTDAQSNMVNQLAGVDTSGLSLICIPTLYYGVLQKWQGRKFLGFQRGFEPSEKMAEGLNRKLFETGGSVSTFAIDIGLAFKCSRIVCMGLDLAYFDNKRHMGEELGKSIIDNAEILRQVESVDGKKIYTSNNLDNYRQWIEKRIANRTAEEMKVELINVSKGARIAGMRNEPDYFA